MTNQIQSLSWRALLFCLTPTAICTSAALAQTGRMEIIEIRGINPVLKVSEGNAITPARAGMVVGAQAVICPADSAVNKVSVLLRPADGGDERPVTLGGSATCPTVTSAWEQATGSKLRWAQGVFKLFRSPGGATVGVSASTTGGTRGGDEVKGKDLPSTNGQGCLIDQLKPLAKTPYVYLPEGKHTITFATSMRDGQSVEVVDVSGKVLATAKASDRRLELPLLDYAGKQDLTLRSSQDERCHVTISVMQPLSGLRFEDALAAAPNHDFAKALYADEIMSDPKAENMADPRELLAVWYPYALSLIKPSMLPGATSEPQSNASWKKWWAYWQAEAAKPVTK